MGKPPSNKDDELEQRRTLRKSLEIDLPTDGEFDAFCNTFFPEVYRRFSRAMEFVEKVNLLTQIKDSKEILKCLHWYISDRRSVSDHYKGQVGEQDRHRSNPLLRILVVWTLAWETLRRIFTNLWRTALNLFAANSIVVATAGTVCALGTVAVYRSHLSSHSPKKGELLLSETENTYSVQNRSSSRPGMTFDAADFCLNLPGVQSQVPKNMILDHQHNCIIKRTKAPPFKPACWLGFVTATGACSSLKQSLPISSPGCQSFSITRTEYCSWFKKDIKLCLSQTNFMPAIKNVQKYCNSSFIKKKYPECRYRAKRQRNALDVYNYTCENSSHDNDM